MKIELLLSKGKRNIIHNYTADESDTIVIYSIFRIFDCVIIKSQIGNSILQTNLKCGLLNTYVLWNTFFF